MCAYSFHSCCNLIISEDNVTKTAAKGFIRIKWFLVDFTESTSKNMSSYWFFCSYLLLLRFFEGRCFDCITFVVVVAGAAVAAAAVCMEKWRASRTTTTTLKVLCAHTFTPCEHTLFITRWQSRQAKQKKNRRKSGMFSYMLLWCVANETSKMTCDYYCIPASDMVFRMVGRHSRMHALLIH